MTNTLDDFCRSLMDALDEASCPETIDPERTAGEFVRFFGLSARPRMDEMTEMLYHAGIGAVSGASHLPGGMRGVHYSAPDGGYDIHYLEGQSEGAREHTVLHETYEVIHETLCDLLSGSPPPKTVCKEADRFAAAVLMQPESFSLFAEASGFDVIALQRQYRRSYASVTLRLGELMRGQPLMAVLYERREREGPFAWAEPPTPSRFGASVVARTPGFGARDCRVLCGSRGGTPYKGRSLSPGSLAERVVNTGRAAYAEVEPGHTCAGAGGVAVSARPVVWHGRLAKVAVVAVPYRDRAVLSPQLGQASFERILGAYQVI